MSQQYDQPAVESDGTTLVPLRGIFETLGATVNWDGATQTISAHKGSTAITLRLGDLTAYVNGAPVQLSRAPQTMNNRTMVPLRFVSEALGAHVAWDGATRTVSITHQAQEISFQPLTGPFTDVVSVSAGGDGSLALQSDGTAWVWGRNEGEPEGQGVPTHTPQRLAGLPTVKAVAAGREHFVLLMADGTVMTWGRNGHAQLGIGPSWHKPTPHTVPGLSQVVAVAAGNVMTIALRADGTVWTWGGDGGYQSPSAPKQVAGLSNIKAVARGEYHSLAVDNNGIVWAWGDNQKGQLGDGTKTDRTVPVRVAGISDVVAVSAGYFHSLALRRDGTVWAWGENDGGALGLPSLTESLRPVQVSGISGVKAIAATAAMQSVALKTDGTVWAWGWNESHRAVPGASTGQLYSPVQVPGLPDMVAISAGGGFSEAVGRDGTVHTWGFNREGQLGAGDFAEHQGLVTVGGKPDAATPVQATAPAESSLLTHLGSRFGEIQLGGRRIAVSWEITDRTDAPSLYVIGRLTDAGFTDVLQLLRDGYGKALQDWFRPAGDLAASFYPNTGGRGLSVYLHYKGVWVQKPTATFDSVSPSSHGGWLVQQLVLAYDRIYDGQPGRVWSPLGSVAGAEIVPQTNLPPLSLAEALQLIETDYASFTVGGKSFSPSPRYMSFSTLPKGNSAPGFLMLTLPTDQGYALSDMLHGGDVDARKAEAERALGRIVDVYERAFPGQDVTGVLLYRTSDGRTNILVDLIRLGGQQYAEWQ